MTESDMRATAPYTDAAHAGVGDGLRGMRGGRPRALERRRLLQQEEKRQWGDAWKDTGRIFTEEDGSLLHPGKISDLFERLVAEAGLPPVRLHDLRHGAATLMPAASVDIKVVSETLGHSDSRITRDIYQSVLDDLARAATEAVVKLVPRALTNMTVVRRPLAAPDHHLRARWGCRRRPRRFLKPACPLT